MRLDISESKVNKGTFILHLEKKGKTSPIAEASIDQAKEMVEMVDAFNAASEIAKLSTTCGSPELHAEIRSSLVPAFFPPEKSKEMKRGFVIMIENQSGIRFHIPKSEPEIMGELEAEKEMALMYANQFNKVSNGRIRLSSVTQMYICECELKKGKYTAYDGEKIVCEFTK